MHNIMDVNEKKTKKIMKNKKRIHCTYTCFPVNGKREQCIEREVCMYIVYICFVYVSHERLSAADPYRAIVNDLLLSSPFH